MAEFTNVSPVTVPAGQNVPLTETPIPGGSCIVHRQGAGLVTLRGQTNQCRARYKVSFGANIAVPTGGTVGEISAALSVDGEALASATALYTPAAVEEFGNIYISVFVDVPRGCCVTVAAENISGQPITFANNNLIIERVS